MSQEKKEKRNTELMDLCVDLWVCVSLFLDYKTVLSLLRVSKEIYSIFQMKNFSHICRYLDFTLNCKSSSIFSKPEEFKELEKNFPEQMFVKRLRIDRLKKGQKKQHYRLFLENFEENMKLSRLLIPKFPNLKKLCIYGPQDHGNRGNWGNDEDDVSSLTCINSRRKIFLTPKFFKLIPSIRILHLSTVSVIESQDKACKEEINFILEDLCRLEELSLSFINVSKHIGDFKEMKKLKKLNLSVVSFKTKICFDLKTLEELNLSHFVAPQLDLNNSFLEDVTDITLAGLGGDDLFNEDDQTVHFFSKCPNLERLCLDSFFGDEINEELKYLQKNTLKSLSIYNSIDNINMMTGDCFSTFSKSLEVIEIVLDGMEKELSLEFHGLMSKLSVFVNLRELIIQEYNEHSASTLLDQPFQCLSPKLEKLDLYRMKSFSDDGFSKFRSLRSVNIRKCNQKHITVKFPRMLFNSNPNLECLVLNLNKGIKLERSDPNLDEKLKMIKRQRVRAFPFYKDEETIISEELRVWGFEKEISDDEVYCRDCEEVCEEIFKCDLCDLDRCHCKVTYCWKCSSRYCSICCELEPVCPDCRVDDSSNSSEDCRDDDS